MFSMNLLWEPCPQQKFCKSIKDLKLLPCYKYFLLQSIIKIKFIWHPTTQTHIKISFTTWDAYSNIFMSFFLNWPWSTNSIMIHQWVHYQQFENHWFRLANVGTLNHSSKLTNFWKQCQIHCSPMWVSSNQHNPIYKNQTASTMCYAPLINLISLLV